MDGTELADFLRRGRARLSPSDVGLTGGVRRRTPGLRREEVARLAGMSADYYARLEQARGPRPSRQMLGALARALRLTEDERGRLFHLAGEEPSPARRRGDPAYDRAGSAHVRPALLLVLDRLHDTPAQVVSDAGDVLAQNALAAALVGDLSSGHRLCEAPDAHGVADVADVAVDGSSALRFRHPVVGSLELDREVLLSAGHGQRLIVCSARPGTDSYERLRLLRVVGLQDLTPSGPG
ncbi:MmyB family transcriptional regulator [Streptomyces sp. H39-S7]|uniref:MmyB family transcriptional regulator n=1 Tax=Streptomyces sp. H39-S7 TaxID=3004357 RepID=UPI0022AF5271|nr:helix-turn-helix domain-containing protein [Streptomyces sp. H39-S7]MCZ4120376.1 helix-turn-helix domain-containing protein [Streptomyces sp. H39-S7]